MKVRYFEGKKWNTVAIIYGSFQKFLVRCGGVEEKPHSYLPKDGMVSYETLSGMNTDILLQWASRFVNQTQELRREYKNIVLPYDEFAAHASLKTLWLLRDN